jgi:multidrug transporter EmrE-like cation transporter
MKSSGVLIFSFLYALFNVSAAVLIKRKLLTHKIGGFTDFFVFLIDPKIFVAIILIVISMFWSMKTLSMSSFSLAIPLMTSINFILTIIFAVFFFKDHLVFSSYIGLMMILSGILVLAHSYGR